ncbi:WD40 repeat domain-containing protein [Sphaerisporangium krabiense]|uniref:WD40 repeat domain-containing protein n=1 Tax=Sphaerisporangium krabiense TaxID=763782 RepID=A0A7W8Z1Y1_9ACTN|nr:hypothetical protein [Sphaerisporangium krabiense]MBB5625901.1 hypothetical protein [Sphaerisporangium krabiense]
MTNQKSPVRPGLANFEVFVDTCLRIAAENGIALPPGLGDPRAWDEAYRDLREQVDRHPRRAVPRPGPARPPTATAIVPGRTDAADDGRDTPAAPTSMTDVPDVPRPAEVADVPEAVRENGRIPRRRVLFVAGAALVAGAGLAIPAWSYGPWSEDAEPGPAKPGPAKPGAGSYRGTGTLLSLALAEEDPVWSVAVGVHKGELVALAGRADGTVQVWDPVNGKARSAPLTGHAKPVYSIAMRAPLAVSAGVDGTLRRWDLAAYPPASTRIGRGEPGGGVNGVALATVGGHTVAVSAGDDRTVRVWDPALPGRTGEILGGRLDTEVKSIAAGTAKGRPIAVSGGADGTVRLWDLTTRRPAGLLGGHDSTVGTVAIGTVNGGTVAVTGSEDGVVRVWDLSGAEPLGRMLGDRIHSAVKSVAIGTLDGATVVVAGSDDAAIRVFALGSGHPYGDGLTGPETAAESIAIGRLGDRTVVVSGHWDGTLWAWSL